MGPPSHTRKPVGKVIARLAFERDFPESVPTYISDLRSTNIEPPYVLMLTIVGRQELSDGYPGENRPRIGALRCPVLVGPRPTVLEFFARRAWNPLRARQGCHKTRTVTWSGPADPYRGALIFPTVILDLRFLAPPILRTNL